MYKDAYFLKIIITILKILNYLLIIYTFINLNLWKLKYTIVIFQQHPDFFSPVYN